MNIEPRPGDWLTALDVCVIRVALVFHSLPDNMRMLMPVHRDAERAKDRECYHGTDGFMKNTHTYTWAQRLHTKPTHIEWEALINIHHTHTRV